MGTVSDGASSSRVWLDGHKHASVSLHSPVSYISSRVFNTVLSHVTMSYPSIEEYPSETLVSITTSPQQLAQQKAVRDQNLSECLGVGYLHRAHTV